MSQESGMTMYQLEDYVKTIEALKKEYREDITIFLALEMEYFPGIFEPTIEETDSIHGLSAFGTAFFL